MDGKRKGSTSNPYSRGGGGGGGGSGGNGNSSRSSVKSPPCCRLGKMCQNPLCPSCFPQLGKRRSDEAQKERRSMEAAAWESSETTTTTTTTTSGAVATQQQQPSLATAVPLSPPTTRVVSAELVELVVVVCSRNGTRQSVLKAIRCLRNDTLAQIRQHVISDEIPSLRNQRYSFLRIVAGHVVHVTADQESGPKAYKAKHFAPPHANAPQLLICCNNNHKKRATYYAAGPPPPTTSNLQRQVTEGMIEFCVRLMTDGRREYDSTENSLGMIRLHRDATMSEIRKALAVQLPQTAPNKYKFVRMLEGEVTLLTRAQEGGGGGGGGDDDDINKKPLRAYHFAPPYTAKAELILLTRKTYREGEIVQDETKTRELKSLASALCSPRQHQQSNNPRGKGKNPRDMVKEKGAQYVNAFLNSAGGVLIFGASDDGVIERVPISGTADQNCKTLEDRVLLARAAKDDIRKLVDGISVAMDPVVDDDLVATVFVPVLRRERDDEGTATDDDKQVRSAEEEIYNVIEVHVKPGRRSLYFLDENSSLAFERRDGSTHLMDANAIAEALEISRQSGNASSEDGDYAIWRGGWRQLRSSFDFDALMRRMSDPWAGREWLFAAVRQSIFRAMQEKPPPGIKSRYDGVGITGSRGMGKSSFMSELALRPVHSTNLNVVAHHLCRTDDPDTLNPALFVHSLAAMLARRYKDYRLLMTDSSTHPGRDSNSAAMLRVLRPEHCESDPEDALLRGILQPLREIEIRQKESKSQGKDKLRIPMVILVDAVDESLAADSDIYLGRRSLSSIAHLLERALMFGGFPPWLKLIVSFRRELAEVPGPIQRMAQRLELIDLDPELTNVTEVQQAREDIRLFVEAYMERNRMSSPLGSHVGSGKWNFEIAATAAAKLRTLRSDKSMEWEYEAHPGKWVELNELAATDARYAYSTDLRNCFYVNGKQLFLVDFETNTQQNARSGMVQSIRMREVDPAGNKALENAQKRTDRESLLKHEHELLESLASNSLGNYLYARSVLEDIASSRLDWEQVPSLPSGLDHLYTRFFRVHFDDGDVEVDVGGTDTRSKPSFRAVKPVLEVLLAATKRGVTERDIAHAVVAGGVCDPTAVPFCLRDIRWALDVDNSGALPRYSLRHESIRAWLRDDTNASNFGLREEHGHALLAASLIQRCWPQQAALSSWLHSDSELSSISIGPVWYLWGDWEPNDEDEDIFNLVNHLILSDLGGDDEKVAMLKSIGAQNINSVFRGKTTALHSAAATGNIKALKLLLDAGASPDMPVCGRRPLHLAAGKGYSKTVDMLLSAGADVSSRTIPSGRTALLNAAGRGSVSTVKFILESITKFENSVGYRRDKSVKPLVDVSQADTGRTPLSVAAEEGHDEVIGLLIDANASVFLADRWGRTPIYYAARYGRVGANVVKALASAPRGQDTLKWGECRHSKSPLHAAVRHGHVPIVRALLESGADPNLVEKDGSGPLHEAVYCTERIQRNNQSAVTHSEGALEGDESAKLEILHLILSTGCCIVDLREAHGCTPLWYAAGRGWTRAVEALLDAGADPDPSELPSLSGRQGPASPLMHTLDRGHYESAAALLARGAHLPQSFDVDAFVSLNQIPAEYAEVLHRSVIKQEKPTPVSNVTAEIAKQCDPIPSEAFARSTEILNEED